MFNLIGCGKAQRQADSATDRLAEFGIARQSSLDVDHVNEAILGSLRIGRIATQGSPSSRSTKHARMLRWFGEHDCKQAQSGVAIARRLHRSCERIPGLLRVHMTVGRQ